MHYRNTELTKATLHKTNTHKPEKRERERKRSFMMSDIKQKKRERKKVTIENKSKPTAKSKLWKVAFVFFGTML